MKSQIIQQGAEEVLIKKGNLLLKRRIAKGYRIKEMDDRIRKNRTKREARLLEKAGKIVPVPKLIKVDEKAKEIDMEFIEGLKLSESLDEIENWREVCVEIGKNIALLHDEGIIHGDLTTSNLIWVSTDRGARPPSLKHAQKKLSHHPPTKPQKVSVDNDGKLFFIDFGLGFGNGRIEDKAVDLYLIKEALEAKHFKRFEEYFAAVLKGYKVSKNYKETLKRLEKVEKRGRYKEQY
ncbi:MAG: RIO1 family regulatory kinase/ATPase [Nanoarchaeota archaeon]